MGRIELKSLEQVKWMREAGLVVADIHRSLREAARPGITTRELDAVSSQAIRRAGATSNFLNYAGYPATVCISINDVVIHGIPGERTLEEGDLVSFDCGAWVSRNGREWHGDAKDLFLLLSSPTWAPLSPRTFLCSCATHPYPSLYTSWAFSLVETSQRDRKSVV